MRPFALLVILTAAILCPTVATATTWYVHPDPDSGDATTIAGGLALADYGDTVLVGPGTYYEHDIDMQNGVTLVSEWGPSVTVIDAQQQGRVISCTDVDNTSTIEGLTITGGSATGSTWPHGCGGGIKCNASSPTIAHCDILLNSAVEDAGGIYCQQDCSPRITNCTLSGNTATNGGGGIRLDAQCSAEIDSCAFWGNSARHGGGVELGGEGSSCQIRWCTFAGNHAEQTGGGLTIGYVYATCSVDHSILWGNCADSEGDQVYLAYTSCEITFSCSDVDTLGIEGPGDVTLQADNIFTDPVFCDSEDCSSAPTTAGDYHLRPCSPCADAPGCGLIGALPVQDCCRVWHVPGDANTIQAGIDLAQACDTVLVDDGTFSGPGNRGISFGGKPIVLRSESGDSTGCIIDCENAARAFYFDNFEGPGAMIQGITIRNGYAFSAGAVYCDSSNSPTIRSCVFLSNHATHGGAAYIQKHSSPTLVDCVFSQNEAGEGGAVFCYRASPHFIRCLFESNTSDGVTGGAIHCEEVSHLLATDCSFVGNTADDGDGGAIATNWSSADLVDCAFMGNWVTGARVGGAVACMASSNVTVIRGIFAGNSAAYGGGTYCSYSTVSVDSSTFYGNSGTGSAVALQSYSCADLNNTIMSFSIAGEGVFHDGTGGVSLACCDVYGNAGGDWVGSIADQYGTNGNIAEDPMFCDPSEGNYYLQVGSPCAPPDSPPGCGLIGVFGVGQIANASFAPSDTTLCGGGEVCFRNLTEADSVTSWVWFFGDGDSSTDFEPCHTYSGTGTRQILLIATGPCGADTAVGQVAVADEPPSAAFSSTITRGVFGCAPLEVCFTDLSTGGAAWKYWDFGDGTDTTDVAHVCHTYTYGDTFDVTLIVGNPCGWDTLTKTNHVLVFDSPVAVMSADADSVCIGQTICFHDLSTGMYTERYWDFGDGSDTTGVTDPCHVYVEDGVKTVQMVISGPFCGADTTALPVQVCAPPVARIWADTTAGLAPLTVTFCDSSTGCISTRVWSFGDGSPPESTVCATHTFLPPDTFAVKLFTEGLCGSDSDTLEVIALSTGILCFDPTVLDTTYNCLTWDTVHVDITLDANVHPVSEVAFDVTYESSYFKFLNCSRGSLTPDWDPIGCESTRDQDVILISGQRGDGTPIAEGASGSVVRLTFMMDCAGMVYGDSIPSLQCITNMSDDCSTFVACECRDWTLTGVADLLLQPPLEMSLRENYPNPFNPGTTIEYDLPAPGGWVNLSIYDVRGRLVRTLVDRSLLPGHYETLWNGKDDSGTAVSSGLYFCRMQAGEFTATRKMVLMR